MLFGSQNVTQMIMLMIHTRVLVVIDLNMTLSVSSVVSGYGWT